MSNKQTTAMQELIDRVDSLKGKYGIDVDATIATVIDISTELLTKEREQITDAFMAGESNQGSHHPSFYEAMGYFAQTFKQD